MSHIANESCFDVCVCLKSFLVERVQKAAPLLFQSLHTVKFSEEGRFILYKNLSESNMNALVSEVRLFLKDNADSDDYLLWVVNQENRNFELNSGCWYLNPWRPYRKTTYSIEIDE